MIRETKNKKRYLDPTRSNIGLEYEYGRKLDALIDEMAHEVLFAIGACYSANEPEIFSLAQDGAQILPFKRQFATDASPAATLISTMRRLTRDWQARFDKLAPQLAAWFAKSSLERSDMALKSALRRAGFTVKFTMTRAVNDTYRAVIGENVGLIKSIPQQYLTQVEGMVMRSVQTGRDLGQLSKDLQEQLNVTRKRAAFISRDQNNKATAVVVRVRHQEIGLTEARWQHSHGGKVTRPTHVRASRDRTVYKIAEGWLDPAIDKYIWPGTEINCRCVAIPIISGF